MLDPRFGSPKTFGQILDHTFSLSKAKFKDFFLMMLIFLGPVYLLQAIIEMAMGVQFVREFSSMGGLFESFLYDYEDTAFTATDIATVIASMMSIFTAPLAFASILIAINHMRVGEEYQLSAVVKQAISRYGGLLGSTILFLIMVMTILFTTVFIVSIFTVTLSLANLITGILIGILLFIGLFIGAGLLFTRWGFYFSTVVFREGMPGFTRSWRLTKGRTWTLFGIYFVFMIIISTINFALGSTFGVLLGNSVLYSMIQNVVYLVTLTLFTVGYAVMFFDLKIRHDADDLKEMIDQYDE
ncbi:hypothetical protein ACFFIS_04065 [Virgibacillus soli]|uniref:Glycerophosphoryl diester phosphodiesterase membrane domain-containing protein n=1 Tax=Paracerasibacillus soli TaxID=480284 RepID=A0ABU5CTY4_9BACI|nr:hypothetical protein [Virgibacillus soli]MDY0408895.1 hypothetical protein [Virgibacillus soli]